MSSGWRFELVLILLSKNNVLICIYICGVLICVNCNEVWFILGIGLLSFKIAFLVSLLTLGENVTLLVLIEPNMFRVLQPK